MVENYRMEALKRNKTFQKAAITRMEGRLARMEQPVTGGQLKQLSQQVEGALEKIDGCVQALVNDVELRVNDEYIEVQNDLLDMIERLQNLKVEIFEKDEEMNGQNVQNVVEHKVTPVVNQVRLPPIELPCFDGRLDRWLSFRETFVAMIHYNATLSDVERLHYLQGCLKGEVVSLTRGLPVSAEGYKIAWELLTRRFDNHRETVYAHIDRLFNQEKVTGELEMQLVQLIDTTRESLAALRSLGQKVEEWDSILVWMLKKKVDVQTHREWELTLMDKQVPRVERFLEFVERRAAAILSEGMEQGKERHNVRERVGAGQRSGGERVGAGQRYGGEGRGAGQRSGGEGRYKMSSYYTKLRSLEGNIGNCIICKKKHEISECPEFRRMSVEDRRKMVTRYVLCYNCLSRVHKRLDCKERPCRKCNARHHILLHWTNDKSQVGVVNQDAVTRKDWVCKKDQVILPTVLVALRDRTGRTYRCRALLDTGSEVSLISEKLVRQLGIKHKVTDGIALMGVGAKSAGTPRGIVDLHIHPINGKTE